MKTILIPLIRLGGRLAVIILMPALTLWMVLALYYSFFWGVIFSVIVAASILFVLAYVKGLFRVAGLACALFLIIFLWHLAIRPSQHRNWQPPAARLSTATFSADSNMVSISNIRNFDYRTKSDYDVRYYDKTFDLAKIRGVDLIVSYWGNEAMAHTFVSFEFKGNEFLSVSIEIRPEMGESFSPIAGMFKQYEIIYVLGDERDLIRLRTNYREEDTFLYKSTATPQQARYLFIDMLSRVNQLAEKPAFYHTVNANCTTSLVKHVNTILKNDIPFSTRLLFSGFSDKLAFMNGNIRQDLSFYELKAACYITEIAQELDADSLFSTKIRKHIKDEIMVRRESD